MPNVVVKWNKNKYPIEVNPSDGLETFKAQLYALTNVPIERQTLLVKGKKLNTDDDLQGLKEKAKVMMMGTADELPPEPVKPIVFAEDLGAERKVAAGQRPGLQNLGNTCYMNSTVQCLHGVPPLNDALKRFYEEKAGNINDLSFSLVKSFGQLMSSLDSATETVTPSLYTMYFRRAFPQFAERTREGNFAQQDADEALTQLSSALGAQLQSTPADASDEKNVIEYCFGGEFKTKMECPEAPEEPASYGTESFKKLKCHIDNQTNYLHQGVENALTEEIEKRSPSLGRNALYKKSFRITKLPRFLTIQFVRFFWKKEIQKKSKILRKVVFPEKLDIAPYCDDDLKKKIVKKRDLEIEAKHIAELAETDSDAKAMDIDTDDAMPDLDHSGYYELFGVVTHKGRSADGGHYIGWVRQKGDAWLKFDDDVVTEQTTEDIKKLVGGGDWHMAYLCFYRLVKDEKSTSS